MTTDYELTFDDYYSMVKRRWPLMLLVFAMIFVTAITVAFVTPPVYRSSSTIIVETQGIPDQMMSGKGNVLTEERIQFIKQRVMTRGHLLAIIDEYDLYTGVREKVSSVDLLAIIRSSIGIELIDASKNPNQPWKKSQTIAFKLYFDYGDPVQANIVTNKLVTLFLDENTKSSTLRATETTQFFTQEAEKLKSELERLEAEIADYKKKYNYALPEHLDMRLNMISRAENELRDVDVEYKNSQEELRLLKVELTAAKSGAIQETSDSGREEADLPSLIDEYLRLSSKYTQQHPDIKMIKRKIYSLGGEIPDLNTTGDTGYASNGLQGNYSLAVSKVQTKIDVVSDRIETLLKEKMRLTKKIAESEKAVLEAPEVERVLNALSRDHQNAKNKYDELREKQMNAQISQSLHGDNKAEQFTLLEPPTLPEKPIKPNRKKMALFGLVLAIVGSGGVLFLLESLDKRVRGSRSLTRVLMETPLITIPYIQTSHEHERDMLLRKYVVIVSISIIIISLIVIHFTYMPLDILILTVLAWM